MNILLDTTVLIDVLRNRRNRRALLAQLIEQGHILATAALNIGEVYSGMRPAEASQTAAFIDNLQCFPITATIARRAGSLRYESSLKGLTLSLADMIVAATALEHSLTLITDNRKDFPIKELLFHPLP
jgi:predicted nucleic acid-binding protein